MGFDFRESDVSESSESGDWESARGGGGSGANEPASSSESSITSALLYTGSLVLGRGRDRDAGAVTGRGCSASFDSRGAGAFFLGWGRLFFSCGGSKSAAPEGAASSTGWFRFVGFLFLDSAWSKGAGGGGSDDEEDAKKFGGWPVGAMIGCGDTCLWFLPSSSITARFRFFEGDSPASLAPGTCLRFLADSGVEVGKGSVLEGGSEGGSCELITGTG